MKPKIKIIVAGAGNVAHHLIPLLSQYHDIIGLYAPSPKHVKELAEKHQLAWTCEWESLPFAEADVLWLLVPDDAIEQVIPSTSFQGVLIHSSGSTSIAKLQSDKRAVIYPLQTFSKDKAVNWNSIPVFHENEGSNSAILDSLLGLFEGPKYPMDSEARLKLHLSAVVACNFNNFMLHWAKNNLDSPEHFQYLQPLVEETIQKAFGLGPELAQTGPAKRGDQKVMDKHVQLIQKAAFKDLYRSISTLIQDEKL